MVSGGNVVFWTLIGTVVVVAGGSAVNETGRIGVELSFRPSCHISHGINSENTSLGNVSTFSL